MNGSIGQTWTNDCDIDQVRIFNTVLTQTQVTTLARGIATSYSGAATNVNFNGYLDFAPDFVWIKARNSAIGNVLIDSVRGASKLLQSETTSAETTYAGVTSFDANGFTVNGIGIVGTNANTVDYVSWNWKAGGAAITNNDGTIAGQVSANKDSGFSIVKYTGNNTDGATVGTGLTEACNIVIVKDLTSANYWCVGGSTVGNGENLYLNDAGQKQTRDRVKSVQTNTFTLGSHFEVNSSNNFIAYCFHSVTGYSKIGSYVGTGTTTGNVVTVGFEPSWVMFKPTSTTGYWYILDNKRSTANPRNDGLFPNDSLAEIESTNYNVDFLSNGFELKNNTIGFNQNNVTYLYMAFA